MKKFLKDFIEWDKKLKKDSLSDSEEQQFKNFNTENQYLIESFHNKIKNFEDIPNDLVFDAHDGVILSHSKKHNTVEIRTLFFKKDNDNKFLEKGCANILLTLSKFSPGFSKLKESKTSIYSLYITDTKIGCIFDNKGKLDYFLEDNIVEIAVIRSVTIEFEEYKNSIIKID